MSAETKLRRFGKSAAKVAALGGLAGAAAVAGITIREHRQLTHRSLEPSPSVQKLTDLEQRSIGITEPYTWAAVHRIHHRWTDATGYPFYRIYHAMQEAKSRGIPVPDTFEGLDPFVKSFDRQTVATIGKLADAEVRDRMKDRYQTPTFDHVSDRTITAILNPKEPAYYYPDQTNKLHEKDFTQDDIAQILLTDPHSPSLMKRENGVQGVAIGNIGLYTYAADLFRRIPDLRPDDLQIPDGEDNRSTKNAVIGGYLAPAVAMFLLNREYTAKGALKAAVEGAAINGVKIGMEAVGGNITNSAGHMGEDKLIKALSQTRYRINLKPDGTVTTNTVGKGPLGRLLSWLTFDEVGGQEEHHKYPEKIAYTSAKGKRAWLEAPWGKTLETLANNQHFPFLQPGEGFGDGSRPDVPSDAVVLINQRRAEQYAQEHTLYEAA